MAYKVNKPIPKGDGTMIAAGTIVDGRGWRNLRTLVSNRWLIPVEVVAADATVVVADAEPVQAKGRKSAAKE
jgi:hypothetical protein